MNLTRESVRRKNSTHITSELSNALSRLAQNQSFPLVLIQFLQTSLKEFSFRAHLPPMALHRGHRDLASIFQVVRVHSVQFSSSA